MTITDSSHVRDDGYEPLLGTVVPSVLVIKAKYKTEIRRVCVPLFDISQSLSLTTFGFSDTGANPVSENADFEWDTSNDYHLVLKTLGKAFGLPPGSMKLTYVDEYNDRVALDSRNELLAAMRTIDWAHGEDLLHVFIGTSFYISGLFNDQCLTHKRHVDPKDMDTTHGKSQFHLDSVPKFEISDSENEPVLDTRLFSPQSGMWTDSGFFVPSIKADYDASSSYSEDGDDFNEAVVGISTDEESGSVGLPSPREKTSSNFGAQATTFSYIARREFSQQCELLAPRITVSVGVQTTTGENVVEAATSPGHLHTDKAVTAILARFDCGCRVVD